MNSEREIYGVAKVYLREHGEDAVIEAAMRADALLYYAKCEEQGVAANNCVKISPDNSIDYTVHEERAEVVYLNGDKSEPRKLVNCVIADRRNWKCDHPGVSGPVVVRDGIAKQQIIDGNVIFSVRKWQWWYLKLVGTLPTEIPEQPN